MYQFIRQEYKNKEDAVTKRKYVEVRSPMMKTQVDYVIPAVKGYILSIFSY